MELPSYDELRARTDGAPAGTAWGVFGDDDEIGTINLLDSGRVLAGLAEARLGEVHSLNWDIGMPAPHPYRVVPVRVQTGAGTFARDDHVEHLHLQFSSQWDGLRHINLDGTFYNGVDAATVDDPDSTVLGIQHWSRRGIVGRGVLLDVARHCAATGRPIDVGDTFGIDVALLDEVVAAQGVTIETGDILLVRTGWAGWFEGLEPAQRGARFTQTSGQPGLVADESTAAWLWDHHVAAVAADNMAVELAPLDMVPGRFLHFRIIPGFGMPLGELFWLDDLAAACAADRRWTFLFTSAPLHVVGGVGSPPNALAIR